MIGLLCVCVCERAGDRSGGDDNVWHLLRFDYILVHSTGFRTEPECLSIPLPHLFVISPIPMPIYLRFFFLFHFYFSFALRFHSSRVEFGWVKKKNYKKNLTSNPYTTDARRYGKANRLEPMNASSPHSNGLDSVVSCIRIFLSIIQTSRWAHLQRTKSIASITIAGEAVAFETFVVVVVIVVVDCRSVAGGKGLIEYFFGWLWIYSLRVFFCFASPLSLSLPTLLRSLNFK